MIIKIMSYTCRFKQYTLAQTCTTWILSLAVLVFGLEYPEYTVGEEEGSVEVCVRIRAPNDTSVTGVALLSTMDGTALGMYVHACIRLCVCACACTCVRV